MAETAGLVQKMAVIPGTGNTATGCVWIGPTPSNTELLAVQRRSTDSDHVGAFKNSILDALATALVSRREVVAIHDDGNALITSLRIDPA